MLTLPVNRDLYSAMILLFSLSRWEFIPADKPWELFPEDNGFLRVPEGVENATAQTGLPLIALGPTNNTTKLTVELDYRPHRFSPNGYWNRDGVQVAKGSLSGTPLAEFDQLVIVDRHHYAAYEFGRVKESIEED